MPRLLLIALSGPDDSNVGIVTRGGAVVEVVAHGRPVDVLMRAAGLCSPGDLAEARRQLGPGGNRRPFGGFLGAVAASTN